MRTVRKIISTNPLFFAAFFPMAMDGILTLVGQDASYWSNFRVANEMSPAYFVMAQHPVFFVAGGILWFAFTYVLLQRLKHPLNLIVAVAMIAGHTWGSTSWLVRLLRNSGWFDLLDRTDMIVLWFSLIGYFLLIGISSGLAFSKYMDRQKLNQKPTNQVTMQ